MSRITTHVLDTSLGKPASSVEVTLEREQATGAWSTLAKASTNEQGRVADFAHGPLVRGLYRLRFEAGAYFSRTQRTTFFPIIEVCFAIGEPEEHHHVPLLLSPFGYSTYRGT